MTDPSPAGRPGRPERAVVAGIVIAVPDPTRPDDVMRFELREFDNDDSHGGLLAGPRGALSLFAGRPVRIIIEDLGGGSLAG